MEKEGVTIKLNQKINPGQLAKKLADLGYENVRTSTPTKSGEFGWRGNLVDIWLERYKLPVRIDLIGEKIENIYLFNYLTQEKIKRLTEVYIVPFGITPKLAPKWTRAAKFPAGGGKIERLFLSEITPGDLVVHIDHGIGRFLEVVSAEVADQGFVSSSNPPRMTRFARNGVSANQSSPAPRSFSEDGVPMAAQKLGGLAAPVQFLVVEYAKGDKLYVPVEQIERLTKYIGASGFKPRLNSLGTSGWEKIKAKVAESIVKVARDLLDLYARRELTKRLPAPPDTSWQKALEDSFEFEETHDQIKATSEIKKDLESPKPADRVLVGDVGFGKTEVAIRAAFKVVADSKQVAVLVPTTLLAEQHYHLFRSRLEKFPVKIEMLSRFRSKEQQRRILEKLGSGEVDIVIGTHRLLSSDIDFKNLGLLIIDEEHRFGVAHKEKLKSLRTSVDILSMSATPIPRTLHMTLTNLRDISVLREPPAGRQPIETFIGEFDEEKVREAILREIHRGGSAHRSLGEGGQVYYVYNSVATIAKKAAEVASLVPEAKVVFAHGQMDKRIQSAELRINNLEGVMEEFYSGRANVLVCTTIIGSGLDMPNVNTIIIENAQRFGLADLHQLRGRVGRSSRKAYALLFYPKGYVPVGDALERLISIASAKELGAGFALAKKDLEIRGAGNLLGTAQHGNISLVGFELYLQLLSQQIEKLKLTAGVK